MAKLLVVLGNAVTPGKGYSEGPFQTESELRDLVDIAGESEVIEADEREMIHSVFELGDTVARYGGERVFNTPVLKSPPPFVADMYSVVFSTLME